jgi:hypothetical protein
MPRGGKSYGSKFIDNVPFIRGVTAPVIFTLAESKRFLLWVQGRV